MPAQPPTERKYPETAPALEGWTFGSRSRCCTPTPVPAATADAGSRRRRLWELSSHAHCPVVGVCLPLAAVRRLARKVQGSEPLAGDYELHCSTVGDCKHRTPMGEAVQRELDRRFMASLRSAAAAKTTEALRLWWRDQGVSNDLPGALWATLTHPRCTPELEHEVLGQVHLLQHQVGMATRVELARFEALIDENAVLARSLAAAQQRCTRQAAEHAARLALLQADLVRAQGRRLAAESQLAMQREDLQTLREAVPELETRRALTERNALQAERLVELQRCLQQARSELAPQAQRVARGLEPAVPSPVAALASTSTSAPPAAPDLAQRAVLCVGGRTASVPVYRRLVEGSGGRFLHHDGGEEHNVNQLESTLAAADLVICQTGCVSHNAYWRVKDHCKRTGKRCVFVDTPSAAGLRRALAGVDGGA